MPIASTVEFNLSVDDDLAFREIVDVLFDPASRIILKDEGWGEGCREHNGDVSVLMFKVERGHGFSFHLRQAFPANKNPRRACARPGLAMGI